MDITAPDRLDGAASPFPGTRHLNLAVTVSAANRIFLHGRGIDAEAAGDLHVAGSPRDPQVTGGFDLLRGSLSLLGKRLHPRTPPVQR
jgi:translocation and assembly module TamB